jgi:ABC-type Mn2+/Zn2+ transport system ATPase subunit
MTPKASPIISTDAPAIAVSHLNVEFGGHPILEDITFDVPQGSITAVIGPNGSGKTTLVRAILGLVPLKAGTVRLYGSPLEHVRHAVGYVPQRFDFDRDFPITVGEFLDLARHDHNPPEAVIGKLEEVGLSEKLTTQRLGSLSGGQLQRVLIAQAIMNDPIILFLDEPSTGVDMVGEAAFYGLIKHLNERHRTTVLMVTHDIAVTSSLVHQVICVNRRLMCYGAPNVALSEKTLADVFGSHAAAYDHAHLHAHPSEHDAAFPTHPDAAL